MKQVMKVEMYGRTLVIRYFPGKKYEYRVYDIITPYRTMHLDSFESFQEAWEYVGGKLYS